MRSMPTTADGRPIPKLAGDEWNALVAIMVQVAIGRSLTPEEETQRDNMAAANWTARVVAEKLIGRAITQKEMDTINARRKD